MKAEVFLLEKALQELPQAEDCKEQRFYIEKLYSWLDREAVYEFDDLELLFLGGYETVKITLMFEKDPMNKDTKGWFHVSTNIFKQKFKRGY